MLSILFAKGNFYALINQIAYLIESMKDYFSTLSPITVFNKPSLFPISEHAACWEENLDLLLAYSDVNSIWWSYSSNVFRHGRYLVWLELARLGMHLEIYCSSRRQSDCVTEKHGQDYRTNSSRVTQGNRFKRPASRSLENGLRARIGDISNVLLPYIKLGLPIVMSDYGPVTTRDNTFDFIGFTYTSTLTLTLDLWLGLNFPQNLSLRFQYPT